MATISFQMLHNLTFGSIEISELKHLTITIFTITKIQPFVTKNKNFFKMADD